MLRPNGQQNYTSFRSDRLAGYVHRAFASEDFFRVFPELLVATPSSQKILVHKSRNRATFQVQILLNGCLHEMFLKSLRFKSYWHLIFVEPFMPSPARRYLTLAHTLDTIGIATPQVIATSEERLFWATGLTYILTKSVQNKGTLGQYFTGASATLSRQDFLERREIIHRFAEMVQQLHHHQTFHLDLKPENILLGETEGAVPCLVLLDLDTAVMTLSGRGVLPRLLRLLDLFILNGHFFLLTHRKERLRFLAMYSGQTFSHRRFRRLRFFLISSPLLWRLYRGVCATNLIQLTRRLLIGLRIVR